MAWLVGSQPQAQDNINTHTGALRDLLSDQSFPLTRFLATAGLDLHIVISTDIIQLSLTIIVRMNSDFPAATSSTLPVTKLAKPA